MFGKILSSTVNICVYEFRVYSFLYVIKYIIVNDYFCHLCGVILTLKNNGCDTSKGFFHIPLDAQSKVLTAMLAPFGIYVYNVLVMMFLRHVYMKYCRV